MVQNFSRGLTSVPEKTATTVDEDDRLGSQDSTVNSKQINVTPTRDLRRARKIWSVGTVVESTVDILIAIASIYFIVYAILVYKHRGQLASDSFSSALLKAAQYGPSLFPIVFSAIVARFLQVFAQAKLESGARILTLEHLLRSRTVFTTFTAPLLLGSFSIVTPFMLVLWALSPLGGQASLRIISTESNSTSVPNNFTYLAYASAFSNEGIGSASANLLVPINAEFTAAIVSSADSKAAHQDAFGNIKIPIYEQLPQPATPDATGWRDVPEAGVVWSSLTGIPVAGLPTSGNSTFTLNSGYMASDCQVTGEDTDLLFYELAGFNYTSGSGGWSGANFAISASILTFLQSPPAAFVFRAVAVNLESGNSTLTTANCTMSMRYVEVQVTCNGTTCKSVAARPATNPASHIPSSLATAAQKVNLTDYTPLNGLAQPGTDITSFWKNFVNATTPSIGCDATFCPSSAIEGYLVNPLNPFASATAEPIAPEGNEAISERFTQLINTYWINSIAPFQTNGNFTGAATSTASGFDYNSDSNVGTISTTQKVLKCNTVWLVILLVSSIVMILCGIGASMMGMRRRGPDVLDSFSALLRDNPYVHDVHYSSMDDGVDQAKRLRNTIVRMGDVQPNHEVGHVAIGTTGNGVMVAPISRKKWYG